MTRPQLFLETLHRFWMWWPLLPGRAEDVFSRKVFPQKHVRQSRVSQYRGRRFSRPRMVKAVRLPIIMAAPMICVGVGISASSTMPVTNGDHGHQIQKGGREYGSEFLKAIQEGHIGRGGAQDAQKCQIGQRQCGRHLPSGGLVEQKGYEQWNAAECLDGCDLQTVVFGGEALAQIGVGRSRTSWPQRPAGCPEMCLKRDRPVRPRTESGIPRRWRAVSLPE